MDLISLLIAPINAITPTIDDRDGRAARGIDLKIAKLTKFEYARPLDDRDAGMRIWTNVLGTR